MDVAGDGTRGTATRYDLVTGSLNLLRTNGTFGGVNCLAAAAAEPPYEDFGAAPSPGEGFFYLLRARNGCGTGTFGNSSQTPDPRDALDGGSLCM